MSCVSVQSCGCQYDGFYYTAGESFWTNGCSQRCECRGPNDLHCTPVSCTPTQECTIRNGQLGCYDAMSTCTVMGDPHYITFDGALAHFQGTCSYIITENIGNNSETQFSVIATNSHRGNNRVSFVSSVDINLTNQSDNVHVRIGPNIRIKVNGAEESLPTSAGPFGQVMKQGSYIVFDGVDFKVQFDGRSTLLVRIGQHYQNRITGMCGNFNGDPTDDKVLPNGAVAQNDNQFGDSWKSPTSQAGCGSTDDRSGDGLSDCHFLEENIDLCSIITNTSGPFSSCHLHSDPHPFYTSCVYDLCLYTAANGMLCSAVSAYEKTCSVLGLHIPKWRSAVQCEADPCEELNCTEHEWCGQKDGVYGCFCDEHQRAVNESYDLTITCDNSSATISVPRCQLFEAGIQPIVLHLRDESCSGTIQDGQLVFHFDNNNHLCGTVLRSNGTHFMYENTIQHQADSYRNTNHREQNISLHCCCVYPLTQAASMAVHIKPVESYLRKKISVGSGSYNVRIIAYQDADFRFPLTSYPNNTVDMVTDERFYVEVQMEGVDPHQFATVLDSCWATPVNDPNNNVYRDLIISGCPNPADRTIEMIQNGVSTVARFSFRMFTFTDFDNIYLHCNVNLCVLRNNLCTTHCYPGYNRFQRDISYHDSVALSVGPLALTSGSTGVSVQSTGASGIIKSLNTLIGSLLISKILV